MRGQQGLSFRTWAEDDGGEKSLEITKRPLLLAANIFSPFIYLDGDGDTDYAGIDIEIWDIVAHKLGRGIQYVRSPNNVASAIMVIVSQIYKYALSVLRLIIIIGDGCQG